MKTTMFTIANTKTWVSSFIVDGIFSHYQVINPFVSINKEDDSDPTTLKSVKMGADNNPSSTSRLVSLQTRKQALEEKIATKNKELRKLCIQVCVHETFDCLLCL